jgi:hypothetical protein
MERKSEAGRPNDRPRQEDSDASTFNPDGEKRSGGAYVVVDTRSHEQHARGLSKARAESLAAELADGIEARRERPDPHWLQRVGGGSA